MLPARRSDTADMALDPIRSASSALDMIPQATARQASALSNVQATLGAGQDRVELSDAARNRLDQPQVSAEQAVADSIVEGHAVQATIQAAGAEKERFAALVFLLAHHGPPLGQGAK